MNLPNDLYAVIKVLKDTESFRWLSCGDPPVLIPNTEVKPTYTESTVLETAWEDRQLPDPKRQRGRLRSSSLLYEERPSAGRSSFPTIERSSL